MYIYYFSIQFPLPFFISPNPLSLSATLTPRYRRRLSLPLAVLFLCPIPSLVANSLSPLSSGCRSNPYAALAAKALDSKQKHDMSSDHMQAAAAPLGGAGDGRAAGIETGTKLYASNLDYSASNEDIKTVQFRETAGIFASFSGRTGQFNKEKKESGYMHLKRHKISVDNFELLTIIGRGAFGEVRLCREKSTGNIYAVKKLIKSEMELFSEVGDLKRFSIHNDRCGRSIHNDRCGRSKGTAEVVFSRKHDGLAAVKR